MFNLRLPQIESERVFWLARMGVSECQRKFGYVCSEHFLKTDLLILKSKRYLRSGAAPLQYYCDVESSNEKPDEPDCSEFGLHDVTMENFIDLSAFCNPDVVVDDEMCEDESDVKVIDNNVIREHNYCRRDHIPSYRTNSYSNRLKISSLRRTIYGLRKQLKFSNKKITKKNKTFENFDELPPFVQEFFCVVLKHLKKGRPKKYSPEMRQFALTLHYYSPTGYDYVRSKFLSCLPCHQSIRNWYRTVDAKPGFSDTALCALQTLQQQTPYEIVGCISVDGMHLRKHLQCNGNSTTGYVDFGGVIETDKRTLATEALNIMFVGMNVPVKMAIGYFFINGIGTQQLHKLIKIGRQLLYDCGIVSGTLAYDGLSSNFSMSKSLGCDWTNPHNIQSELLFGDLPFKTWAFPDMPHMAKLWRNAFHHFGGFLSGVDSDQKIEWKYVARLFDLQNNLKFRLGNKLTKLHINFKNQIMKVYLATQLFSNSVADAIETCDKSFELPDFQHSAATVKFLRIMNDLFDIFNSVRMTDSGFKQPLHRRNYEVIMSKLEEIRIYVLNMKQFDNTPMYLSARNTPVIGVLVLINSLKELYQEYVEKKQLLSFIPTYKANQDNLEMFHSTMRSHSGYNSNPTCVQYANAFKKTLLHCQLSSKRTGNCIPLEEIQILHENPKFPSPPPIEDYISCIDSSEDELDGMVSNVLMERCINQNHLDVYVNIIAYISGFVAKRVATVIKCDLCISSLTTDDENDSEFFIIHGKRRGGLFFPSRSVREICSVADKTFNHCLKMSKGPMLNVEFTIERMVLVVGKYCMEDTKLFEELETHFRMLPTELHYYVLVKSIATFYLKVRVHYLNKVVSSNTGTRQKNLHETHFQGV